MNNRMKLAAVVGTQKLTLQSEPFSSAPNAAPMALRETLQRGLMGLGLASIAALVLMFFKPDLTDRIKQLSPFATTYPAADDAKAMAFAELLDLHRASDAGSNPSIDQPAVLVESSALVPSKEQQRVTDWLARRYRIAGSASQMLVEAAFTSAHDVRVDPLLVLAVMAIESRFNPFAESSVGAQGLMQVMANVHHEKFIGHGGVKSVLNPVANIRVGALILKDYVRRGGSVEAGLKLYVGAGNMDGDGGYSGKVLAEYQRLQAVSSGKRVPIYTPQLAVPASGEVNEAKAEASPANSKLEAAEPA